MFVKEGKDLTLNVKRANIEKILKDLKDKLTHLKSHKKANLATLKEDFQKNFKKDLKKLKKTVDPSKTNCKKQSPPEGSLSQKKQL